MPSLSGGMSTQPLDYDRTPLAELALGDIVLLPDGRSMTVRVRVSLPVVVGTMAGFAITGELECLLSAPTNADSPINLYVPLDRLPFTDSMLRTVVRGAANYWAPHLPALSAAMGEVLYRVVEIRGSSDPAVIVYRGDEMIVFVKAGFVWPDSLRVTYMRRPTSQGEAVTRYAAVVAPSAARVPTPADQPARTLYETFTR